MSIKKTYSEKTADCKVTFKLEKNLINSGERVNLAGEFNNWDETNTPLKALKSGDYCVTLNLKKGNEYQFKYLVDSKEWVNDPKADKYVPNVFQGENSVVVV